MKQRERSWKAAFVWVMRLITLAVLLGLAGWIFLGHSNPKLQTGEADMAVFCIAVAVSMSLPFTNSIIFSELARKKGFSIPIYESYALALLSGFLNYLPAKAGLAARAGYLKYRYQMPIMAYAAIVFRMQLLLLTAAGVWGLTALIFSREKEAFASSDWAASALLTSMMIIGIAASSNWLWSRFIRLFGWLGVRNVRTYSAALDRSQSTLNLIIVISALLLPLIGMLRILSVAHSLSIPLNMSTAILIQSLIMAGALVPVLPANIGIREALFVFAATVSGIDIGAATSLALLDRLAAMLALLVLGPLASLFLSRRGTPNHQ